MGTDQASESFLRILGWAKDSRLELVEVAAGPLDASKRFRVKLESNLTLPRRIGVGIGWTVGLPSGRHYGALREVTVAVERDLSGGEADRIRNVVSDIAEAEVLRELGGLSNWVLDEGAVIRHITDKEFYDALLPDLDSAQHTVLILAPFLGRRLAQVIPRLVAARDRGVTVTVLVRPQYAAKASAQQYLDPLRAAGVEIVERTNRMHEKVVVVDQHVAYHGSLNPLSHKFTSESMMRFACPPIAESLYVLYHPAAGQSFAERVSIETISGRGRSESRTAWGDPPLWWKVS